MFEALMNPPIPNNRKIFERLMYGSIVVEALNVAVSKMQLSEVVGFVVVAFCVVAFTWAAARKGWRWAAWVLLAIIAGGLVLGFVTPDDTETTLETVLGVISLILQVAALAFYFFGGRKPQPAV